MKTWGFTWAYTNFSLALFIVIRGRSMAYAYSTASRCCRALRFTSGYVQKILSDI